MKGGQGAGFPAELPVESEPAITAGTQTAACLGVIEEPARDRRDIVKDDTQESLKFQMPSQQEAWTEVSSGSWAEVGRLGKMPY